MLKPKLSKSGSSSTSSGGPGSSSITSGSVASSFASSPSAEGEDEEDDLVLEPWILHYGDYMQGVIRDSLTRAKKPLEGFIRQEYMRVLGSGSYAVVQLGTANVNVDGDVSRAEAATDGNSVPTDPVTQEREGTEVAIKYLDVTSGKSPLSKIQQEVHILQTLSDAGHPTAVRFHGYVTPVQARHDNREHRHRLVMEKVEGVELRQHVKGSTNGRLSEFEAVTILQQIAEGLEVAHSWGIAHRDVSDSNILISKITDGVKVKLIDYGLAHLHDMTVEVGPGSVTTYLVEEMLNPFCDSYCGTTRFMAPEMVARKSYNAFKSDVFSLGVSLFYMLTGVYPFLDNHKKDVTFAGPILTFQSQDPLYIKNKFNSEVVSHLSDEAIALLGAMLHFEPALRCELADVVTRSTKWLRKLQTATPINQEPQSATEVEVQQVKVHEVESQQVEVEGSVRPPVISRGIEDSLNRVEERGGLSELDDLAPARYMGSFSSEKSLRMRDFPGILFRRLTKARSMRV